jgi:hypothetical protein
MIDCLIMNVSLVTPVREPKHRNADIHGAAQSFETTKVQYRQCKLGGTIYFSAS